MLGAGAMAEKIAPLATIGESYASIAAGGFGEGLQEAPTHRCRSETTRR